MRDKHNLQQAEAKEPLELVHLNPSTCEVVVRKVAKMGEKLHLVTKELLIEHRYIFS